MKRLQPIKKETEEVKRAGDLEVMTSTCHMLVALERLNEAGAFWWNWVTTRPGGQRA